MEETGDDRSIFEQGLDAVRAEAREFAREPGLTLTTLASLVECAISFGAGIYNDGSPRECYLLYSEAASLALDASHGAEMGHRTSDAIDDLTRALARAATASDAGDANTAAWIMRHVFDKTIVQQQLAVEGVQWMLKLGEAAFARGDYEGSLEALRSGVDFAADVLTHAVTEDPIQAAQLTTIYYSHAMLLTGRFAEATRWLRRGVRLTPQLPLLDFDMRQLGEHWLVFERRILELEDMPLDDPLIEDARLLRSYLYLFSGQRRRAADVLMAMMQRDLDDEIVQLLFTMTVEGDAEA